MSEAAAPPQTTQPATTKQGDLGWEVYNGGVTGDHYSPLRQIDRTNVQQLQVAWTFDTHETGGLETNPLIVGDTLYGYTPTQKVVALQASTGRLLWTYSSGQPGNQPARGFSFWTDGHKSILFAISLMRLVALDPLTGKTIPSFGENGSIDLRKGLGEGDYSKAFVAMTTPGMIFKETIIVGLRAPEVKPALRGDIRAFNVHTGALVWTFHTIPHPGEFGYETWPKEAWKNAGAANNWAGMALDAKRGIVYVPTGSAVTDFYGFDRIGDDLFANTLLALDANTGKRIWHFQGVHHDIWDRDFPSPPALVTVRSGGKTVDAVAQTTKQGMLFLFDRVTGKPLFPIEERPFPASTVPGERASPTQPVAMYPEPFARQRLTEGMLSNRTPAIHSWALDQFSTFRSEGLYVPFGIDTQTVNFPGFDGGAEWGGPAVDPTSGVIYINANDIPWTGGLTARKSGGSAGSKFYTSQCAICHGQNREGSPPIFPALGKNQNGLSDAAVTSIVHGGKGRMPSFPGIDGDDLKSLLAYLKTEPGASSGKPVQAAGPNRNEVAGAALYEQKCVLCHGEDLLGSPSNIPGILGARARLGDEKVLALVHSGRGRMPALASLSQKDASDLLRFLGPPMQPMVAQTSDKQEMEAGGTDSAEPPYLFTGYHRFYDPDGYPAVAPPWGTLNAIDLNTGKYLWKVPLGQYPELVAKGLSATGSENYGGPVVTAGGVLFISATIYDRKMRAFDTSNGHLLWEAEMPFAGVATPATYMVNGKQYLVIATSGSRDLKQPQGSAYVCFALP